MRRFIFSLCCVLLLFPSSVLAQQELPPVNPAEVVGDISISGTNLLEQVTSNISTLFSLEGYTGNVNTSATTTTAAVQQLCNGEVDIIMADRQLTPAEIDACTAAGQPPIAFRVATSALVVTVARQNNFASNITFSELQQIFSTALNWSDVREGWEDTPISRYVPATSTDEFDIFVSLVFGGDGTPLSTSVGTQFTDDPNAALQAISTSTTAIGFFNANYALRNDNLMAGVTIDAIPPTYNNIVDTSYPLTRPLFIYTSTQNLNTKPQVASFLNYYISNVEQEITNVRLFPPPENAIEVAASRWLAATNQGTPGQVATTGPTEPDPVAATATALANVVSGTPVPDATAVVATEAPTSVPVPVEAFDPEVQNLLIQARLDLEVTAQQALGSERPEGWSGSLDVNNPQLPLLIRLDLEVLAANVYGIERRPDGWFGPVNSTQKAIARDIRHDLEILADDVFVSGRPGEWAGGLPIYRCDRSTQALVELLELNGLYTITADPFSLNFCNQVATEVSRFVEVNLVGPDSVQITEDGVSIPPEVTIETTIAVAFYNRSASQRAGVIPLGTGITPIARSYQGFSNMTLVEGENFLIFVEWQNTSLTAAQWETLPDEAEIEFETSCGAVWCEPQG